MLAPVTTALQTYLTYYKPYLELINFNIPGLDDLFQDVGLGHASILGIADILAKTGAIPDPLFQTVVHYSDLLTNLQAGFGDLTARSQFAAGEHDDRHRQLRPRRQRRPPIGDTAGSLAGGGDLSTLAATTRPP